MPRRKNLEAPISIRYVGLPATQPARHRAATLADGFYSSVGFLACLGQNHLAKLLPRDIPASARDGDVIALSEY
jgi:hypothetical protein